MDELEVDRRQQKLAETSADDIELIRRQLSNWLNENKTTSNASITYLRQIDDSLQRAQNLLHYWKMT